jgi:Fic family protein
MMTGDGRARLGTSLLISTSGETVRAHLPPDLPPTPPIDLSRLLPSLLKANAVLSRLDGAASILPSANLFIWMYVRKEALLSSQIEGTQSSLSDLLLFENDIMPRAPFDDVREVSNYVTAIRHGLDRLAGGFPLSLRLIRELHGKLLASGRSNSKQPGEFRTSQNWIGGTRPGNAIFVPPPPDRLAACLDNFERFLQDRETYPTLVRAALAHVQFETIHPFLDGNGRVGRLLITLILCEAGELGQPVLYLSLYLKRHRQRYYELLQSVREQGDWESWLDFFLEGVAETSEQGHATAQRLVDLIAADESKVGTLGRRAGSALRVLTDLKRLPILTVPTAAKRIGLSQPTLQKALDHLQELGIVRELTGRRRDRAYEYSRYLAILDEGTEPLPRGPV